MNPAEKKFFWKWMGIGLALHLVAAVFSIGHQAADEYFQILEFLNFKLGQTPLQDLAVEYAERMRPWFQPAVYYGMAKVWRALGVTDPFVWVWSFRMFAGVVGWASGVLLARHTLHWFSSEAVRKLLIRLTALLWFLPVLHVRPSSEGLGGSLFMVGLALAIWALAPKGDSPEKPRWLPWLSGLLMGLAFESRFQIGVMIAGFAAWWVLFCPFDWKRRAQWLAFWGSGLFAALALGRVIDYWGYGQWACSPWNYIDYNLIRGLVNRYTPSPWWDVLRMSATEAWPILGTLLLLLCALAWFRWPKCVVTWGTAPLLIVHSLIAHKELRFFFPIAHAAPVLVPLALVNAQGSFSRVYLRFQDLLLGRLILRFLAFLNLAALVALLFMPLARNVQFYQAYWHWMKEAPSSRSEVLSFGKDPYEVLGTPTYFYKPREFRLRVIPDWSALRGRLGETPVYLFLMKAEIPQDAPLAVQEACHPVIRTLPGWLFEMKWLNYGNWMSRAQAWSLFECRK